MAVSLHIQEQPRLPLRKQAEICADGIHHRLFRSAVTVSVIALAIAFLMNMLTESMVVRSIKQGVFAEVRDATLLSRFNRFLTGPIDAETLGWQFEEAHAESWQAEALAAWLTTDAAHIQTLRTEWREARRFTDWLDNLSVTHRRILLDRRGVDEALAWLATPAGAAAFEQAVQEMPSVSSPPGLVEFAREYDTWQKQVDHAVHRVNEQLAALRDALHDTPLLDLLADADGSLVSQQAMTDTLNAHGVILPAALMQRLCHDASGARQQQRLTSLLSEPGLARAWQQQFGRVFERDAALEELATGGERCDWLAARESAKDLSREQIRTAADTLTQRRRLTAMRDRIIMNYGESTGIGANVFWLLVVSLLVCIVGITNAMLVSVIERFREIATMKCLGALDGFIAVLFLLEAACLGLVGGAIGVIGGLAIGAGRMLLSFGNWVGRYWPWSDVVMCAAISLAAGLVLATVAAIYPAYRASRMPPMEAMRIE